MRVTLLVILVFSVIGCSQQSDSSDDSGKAFVFSYTSYATILNLYVSDGMVDYAGLKSDRAPLDSLVDLIGRADLSTATKSQQLSFYINAYNAITLRSIVDAYPVTSIRDTQGVLDDTKWRVAGRKVTLYDLEHEILRKKFTEPRIHVALSHAALGSPEMTARPYYPDSLEAQLDEVSRKFAQSEVRNQFFPEESLARISPIFDWFGEDFIPQYYDPETLKHLTQKENAALNFLFAHLPSDRARALATIKWRVSYQAYDWSLNGKK